MTDQHDAGPERTQWWARLDPATIALAVAVLLFALANSRSTKITWIVASSHAPLFVVIAICVAAGFAAGYLTARRSGREP
jgi:uncharacterized integral membrane protein